MWNPDFDVEKGIEEFADALYGDAAPYFVSYVEMVNDPDSYDVDASGLHPKCGAKIPLKKEKAKQMDQLFNDAELTVAAEPETLWRVKLARLSAQYAVLLYADKQDPIRASVAIDFSDTLKRADIPVPTDI